MEVFKGLAQDVGICIAYTESAPSAGEDERFDEVVRNLQPYKNARVVACFCEGMTVRALLRATKRLKVSGEFLFVGRYVIKICQKSIGFVVLEEKFYTVNQLSQR